MITLVIGGSSSGKSLIAETISTSFKSQKLYYIATMKAFDDEGKKRVKKHRDMRNGKGFETIEQYTNVQDIIINNNSTCLLECTSNLLANEMYSDKRVDSFSVEKLLDSFKILAQKCENLVIVSNEVFCDGVEYDEFCSEYVLNLAKINRLLAQISDVVIESVVGIPIYHKGKEKIEGKII